MSSPRLRAQFESLFKYFDGVDSATQIEEIVDVLSCTRRNARIVLNKLVDEGWIRWQPAAGRGKQSRIEFIQDRQTVSESLAKRYLDEGRIGQALDVLNKDANRLTHVIQDYLGVQHEQGKHIIRLPYYRALSMLNPIKSPRRSEQNIIQQIFSGLTKFDEDDQLCPDLAHSWEHIDDNVWRFYLRPSVRFHDGNRLDISDILDSIVSLKKTALFAHISAVHSPSPWVIDVELNLVDFHFPALLALPVAKILPSKLKNDEDFDTKPIGTGPFRVVQNSDKHLVLQAFDDYFGLRPLIDQVEVWVIDEVHSNIVYPCLDTPKLPTKSSTNSVELDPGCTYLLINRTSGLARNSQWNRYFGSVLSSFNLFSLIPQSKVVELGLLHAHGLRPGWVHHTGRDQCEVPENETVKIAFYKEHIAFNLIAKGLEKLLRRDGLDVQLISYTEQEPNIQDVDIWIRPMGISTKRDDSLVSWFLLDSAIEQACDPLLYKEATKLIHEWRSKANLRFNGAELGKLLVENQQMIPLFHCWLGVDKDQSGALQNVKCNALGWFDFSAAWIKPVLVE